MAGSLLQTGCGEQDAGSKAEDEPSGSGGAYLFGGPAVDYELAASPRQLGEWSDVVIAGTISGFESGRVMADGQAGGELPATRRTVLMKVSTDDALAGRLATEGRSVFVELKDFTEQGPMPFEQFTGFRLVAYLARGALCIRPDCPTVTDDGEPKYVLVTSQALNLATNDGVLVPAEFPGRFPLLYPGSSLDDVEPDKEAFPSRVAHVEDLYSLEPR